MRVRLRTLTLVSLISLGMACPGFALGQSTEWTNGSGNGNWFDAANWTSGIPNSSTADIVINAPGNAQLTANAQGNTLVVGTSGVMELLGRNFTFTGTATHTLNNQGSIILQNSSQFWLSGNASSSGEIHVNYTGGATESNLYVGPGGANLTGAGTVNLSGNNARIRGEAGAILATNQTIQGYGNLGFNQIRIENAGLIDANAAGQTLEFDVHGSGGSNSGIMQASNGGTLRFQDGAIDNTGGLIQSQTGSTVIFNANSAITGGEIAGVDNRITGSSTFQDLTLSGNTAVQNASVLNLNGTITNTGDLSANFTGGATQSLLSIGTNTVLLDGGGTTTLSGVNARIGGAAGGVLNIADQTIQGYGNVGLNQIQVNNQAGSLIDANSIGNRLYLDVSGAGGTNAGTLRATSGGILNLQGGNIDNTGGMITSDGSLVEFDAGVNIVGGQIAGTNNHVVGNTSFQNLSHSGNTTIDNSRILTLSGNIENSGTMLANYTSGATEASFYVDSSGATLTGGGALMLSGNSARVRGASGAQFLLADQHLSGFGNVGFNVLGITNSSLSSIDANVAGQQLTIDPGLAGMVNQGLMQASNGGTLLLADGSYNNDLGTIQSLAGSTVLFGTGAEISNGTIGGVDNRIVGNVLFQNVNHTGNSLVENSRKLNIAGTIQNSGHLTMHYTGGATESSLEIGSAGATLTGGGETQLIGNSARIRGASDGILSIGSQTIHGYGNIGLNQIGLVNSSAGLIDANVAGQQLTIDPGNLGMSNQGIMQSSGGGTLSLAGGVYDNTGGTIQSLTGSTLNFDNQAQIKGGQISGDGNFANGSVQFQDLSHTGSTTITNSSSLNLVGTVANSGLIRAQYTGGATSSTVTGDTATLTGGGTLELSGTSARISGGGTFNLDHQTVTGNGNVGFNNTQINNTANTTFRGSLTIDNLGSSFTNNGTLGTWDGSIHVADQLINNGTVALGGNDLLVDEFVINTGLISGDGILSVDTIGSPATYFTNTGEFNPGGVGDTGMLGITAEATSTADVVFDTGSSLTIDIAGAADYDVLTIGGNGEWLINDSVLNVNLLGGFLPTSSMTFTIAQHDANQILGDFANALDGSTYTLASGQGTFDVSYNRGGGSYGSSIVLSNFQAVPEPSSALLLMSAGTALVLRRRRRNQRV